MPRRIDKIVTLSQRDFFDPLTPIWAPYPPIPAGCSGEELARCSGLDVEFEKVPLEWQGRAVPDVYGIRTVTPNSHPLKGVSVGPQYTILQPSRLVELGEEIRKLEPGAEWVAAGTLFESRRAWAIIRLADDIHVPRAWAPKGACDTLTPLLLLSTTFGATQHTALQRTVIQHLVLREASHSTFSAPLDDEHPNQYLVRHTRLEAGRKLAQAQEALAQARGWYKGLLKWTTQLAETPMTLPEAKLFFAQLVTKAKSTEEAKAAFREAREKAPKRWRYLTETATALTDLFHGGEGQRGMDCWDALTAVCEFVDHHRERLRRYRGDTEQEQMDQRFESTQFGWGAAQKVLAASLLTQPPRE